MTADVFDTRGYVLLTSTQAKSFDTGDGAHHWFVRVNIFSKFRKILKWQPMEYHRVRGRGFTKNRKWTILWYCPFNRSLNYERFTGKHSSNIKYKILSHEWVGQFEQMQLWVYEAMFCNLQERNNFEKKQQQSWKRVRGIVLW